MCNHLDPWLGEKYSKAIHGLWAMLKERDYYARATGPYPANHGEHHIKSVLTTIASLLNDPGFQTNKLPEIKKEDWVFQLGVATLVHDLGMGNVGLLTDAGDKQERGMHAEIGRLKTYLANANVGAFVTNDHLEKATLIAWAHAGDAKFKAPDKLQYIDEQSSVAGSYHLSLCVRLLRFADLLDVGPNRINILPSGEWRSDQREHRDKHALIKIVMGPSRVELIVANQLPGVTPPTPREDVVRAVNELRRDIKEQLAGLRPWLPALGFQDTLDMHIWPTSPARNATPVISAPSPRSGPISQVRTLKTAHTIASARPLEYMRTRDKLSPDDWKAFYRQAQRRIWLMGHAMEKCFLEEYSAGVIEERLSKGQVQGRVVILDPYGRANQQLNDMAFSLKDVRLRTKIFDTLRKATELAFRVENKLSVGTTDATMHCTMAIVDDEYIVTVYSHLHDMGNAGITMRFTKGKQPDLAEFYEKEFIWHWVHSRPAMRPNQLNARPESRILNYQPSIAAARQWIESGPGKLKAPHLAIIFPTYTCRHGSRSTIHPKDASKGRYASQLLCPNCMFGGILKGARGIEMTEADFRRVCENVAKLGIRRIELSGGGEPMHHGNARGLVAHLKALRISKPEYEDMEFGLISNVSSLMDAVTDEDFANDLLRTMSYIRWSWPEDGEGIKKLRVAYIDQLTRFLKLNPSSRRSRVGVKILATRQNTHGGKYTEIISLIENLFDIGIDHVKVRTLRPSMLQRKQGAADETASEADLNSCEARAEDLRGLADSLLHLEETLRKNDKISGDKSLEVDVATRYVPNDYKCYLSPLVMVIDPHGDVRMCWNDVEDKQRIIGNAIKSDLADIWGKARHRKVCTEMSASNVCNGRSGCHCRIVGYQADAEKFFGTSVALGGPFPEPRFRDKFV